MGSSTAAAECLCTVWVRREGALASVGHDVALDLPASARVSAADRRVEVVFSPANLRVLGSLKGTLLDSTAPSPEDRKRIEHNAATETLELSKHRDMRWEGSVEATEAGLQLQGTLFLHGAQRPVSLRLLRAGDEWVGELTLRQTDYGIRPYRALLGALRVQDAVEIQVRVKNFQL